MELDRGDVSAIFAIINSLDFVELTIELPNLKIAVSRAADRTRPDAVPTASAVSPVVDSDEKTDTVATLSPEPPAPADDPALVTIDAPMLGTFYRSPKPGDPPYRGVGEKVIAGDVVGLVEVMKMMNPVLAPADGEIHRVLAADNALVEFGQALFELRVTP